MFVKSSRGLRQCSVVLPCDIPFQATCDLAFGLACGQVALQVGAGVGVGPQPGQHDRVDRSVELAVTTTAEPMSSCAEPMSSCVA